MGIAGSLAIGGITGIYYNMNAGDYVTSLCENKAMVYNPLISDMATVCHANDY